MKIIAIPIPFNKKQMYINRVYVDYVLGAGMMPVLVYPNSDYEDITKACDGLMLAGGIDVDPTFYGYNNIASNICNQDRDDFERDVIKAFTDVKKPIFGICRGFQLLFREYMNENNADSLEYRQDIKKHNAPKELKAERDATTHGINIISELLYNNKDKYNRMFVNSIHHQSVILKGSVKKFNKRNDNFKICGSTGFGVGVDDSVVEAFNIKSFRGSPVLAIQWHPEELKDYKLIANFFE